MLQIICWSPVESAEICWSLVESSKFHWIPVESAQWNSMMEFHGLHWNSPYSDGLRRTPLRLNMPIWPLSHQHILAESAGIHWNPAEHVGECTVLSRKQNSSIRCIILTTRSLPRWRQWQWRHHHVTWWYVPQYYWHKYSGKNCHGK